MSAARDHRDLLELPAAELQRALLAVPDELLAQALCAAEEDVRRALLANLSRRRCSEASRKSSSLQSSGEMSARSAAAALHNLVRSVFGVAGPERDAPRADTRAADTSSQQLAEHSPPAGEPGHPPDLSEAAFNHLREVRGVVSSLEGVSGYSKHLRDCARGRSGAVLLKSWLGRKPALAREKIYAAICNQEPPPALPSRP